MNEAVLWKKACELLHEDMSPVSYDTWIEKSLTPVKVRDDMFYIEIVSDFTKKTITSRYSTLIESAVSQAAGRPFRCVFGTERELDNFFADENAFGLRNGLNAKYTFGTFVVGNSNRFAHAASLAVAELPGDAYNPLFIYGGVGLGKTHLMHAIGAYILSQYPGTNLLYVNSENFTNDLITAIRTNKNAEFRDRFRNVDVLMVDDIQFIAGRDSTQEEFFHTFNTLHAAGKQIIITSDKPPKEIQRLEERLVSRFEWGLTTEIQRPDIETRIAILRKRAEYEEVEIGDDVVDIIASRIDSNIRELEGTLTRVIAYAQLAGKPVTRETVEEPLRDLLAIKDKKRITVELIMQAVAEYFSVAVQDLTGGRRTREISVPRQVAMALTRELTELSLTQIGGAFNRDHSTVIHACEKIASTAREDSSTMRQLEDIRYAVRSQ